MKKLLDLESFLAQRGPVILDSRWFNTTKGTIGIVAVQTYANEWKAYIGIGDGVNQSSDEYTIAYHGASVDPHEAAAFFPGADIGLYKKDGVGDAPA
jgi:hypothetical protein